MIVSIHKVVGVGLLVAAALSLASELITRDGVGVVEYVVGVALVLGLLAVAAQLTLRARVG
jgi:uncharacterized membrane protein